MSYAPILERILQPVSSDRGDQDVTLTCGVDSPVQRFATPLTANRTVTLSATGAVNGSWFCIVRTGLGLFTLDVGGLRTVGAGVAGTVDVHYTGSAWVLTRWSAL